MKKAHQIVTERELFQAKGGWFESTSERRPPVVRPITRGGWRGALEIERYVEEAFCQPNTNQITASKISIKETLSNESSMEEWPYGEQ